MRKRLMSYANNKGADQPAHPRSLIGAFVVRCLDSVMSLVSVSKFSSLMLASVAEQASLSLTWSETPEDMFSHDEAEIKLSVMFHNQFTAYCLHLVGGEKNVHEINTPIDEQQTGQFSQARVS